MSVSTGTLGERPVEIESQSAASGSRSVSWWGMVVIILNEAIIFSALFASYFYLRFNAPLWPPEGIKRPELVLPLINTALLVSSSFVLQWGVIGIRHGNQSRLRLGQAVAFLLGAAFLAIQIYEYFHLEFGPQLNTYSSLFYTVTGVHATHVFVGLLMNAYIQVRAWLGHFDADHYQGVENASLYWHFVDAVWLFVLSTVYLSPYL